MAATAIGSTGPARPAWIRSPAVDLAIAFAWVPFTVLAWSVAADGEALAAVLGATFLLSFLHQPLTLPLVYGDPDQFAAHRRLYLLSPVLFLAAILGGLWVSLSVVAVVAGLWNAEHTLMQRYGLTRIYGRKVGQAEPAGEKAMLVSWLVVAVVAVAASTATAGRIAGLRLGRVNANGVRLLVDLQPGAAVLLVPVAAAGAWLTLRWAAGERARWVAGASNPAKLAYLGSTAALFAVIVVDPVPGFIGYVGAHAVEYFVIVHHALGTRYRADGSGGTLGRTVRAHHGVRRFLLGYVAAVVALVVAVKQAGNEELYGFTVLFLGGMHVFYDGFVWKLRKPAISQGLVTPAGQPSPSASQ